jgi:diguanylate cyclase (GGDEF)-like protein
VILSAMRRELLGADPELFAEATERLAALFGPLTGATVDSLMHGARAGRDPLTGLARAEAMRPRLDQLVAAQKRYNQPFALVLFDVDSLENNGNGGSEHDEGLATVATALRQAIRLVDEGYRLEEDELCLLAPMLTSEQGAQMAERLHARLAAPGALGGRPLTIAAGVVSCPEHGDDPDRLLRQADTAMWRARATGRPVTVGGVQDPSQSP